MSVPTERYCIAKAVVAGLSTLLLGMGSAVAQEMPRRIPSPGAARDAPWDNTAPLQSMHTSREGPSTPGWIFIPRGEVDLTYTDNVLLTAQNRSSDFIITPTAGLSAYGSSSRSGLTADIELAHDFYTRTTNLNGLRYKALASGYIGTSDQTLVMRARAATDLQESSTEDVMPATERSFGHNQVQVLNYGIGPTFRHDVSRNVELQARYDFSSVTYLDPPAGPSHYSFNDSHRHVGTIEFSNIDRGSRLDWSATGTYEQTVGTRTTPASRRGNGEGFGRYKVSNSFAVLGRAGYDWIDEPTLSGDFSGAFVRAGFQWTPTPRTSLRVEAGYRYGRPNYEAELLYRRTEWLIVHASYRQGVETPQRLNEENLASLANLIGAPAADSSSGLPPNPNGSGFDISNQAFRNSRAEGGIRGHFGRNSYNLSGYYEERTANGVRGKSKGFDGELTRNLTPLFAFTLTGNYLKTDNPRLVFGPLARSETYIGGARLTYRLTDTTTASVRYAYLQRKTALVYYHENAAVLSLTKTF